LRPISICPAALLIHVAQNCHNSLRPNAWSPRATKISFRLSPTCWTIHMRIIQSRVFYIILIDLDHKSILPASGGIMGSVIIDSYAKE